jgi:hypothetical protein
MSGHRDSHAVFYEVEGQGAEVLRNVSVNDAVQDYLDMVDPDSMPSSLRCFCYRRAKVDPAELRSLEATICSTIYEHLDQEYGDPDGSTGLDDEVRASVKALMETVRRTYVPWTCERDTSMDVMVNVPEWIRKNAPEWLNEANVAAAVRRLEEER